MVLLIFDEGGGALVPYFVIVIGGCGRVLGLSSPDLTLMS